MKSLCTLLALLVAVPLSAQTAKRAPIEAIRVLTLPAGSPPNGPPLDQVLTPITPTVPFCNKPPSTVNSVNPKMVDVSDPFHPGQYCQFSLPTGGLDEGQYLVTATYESLTITECQDTNGYKLSPCATDRAVPVPFEWTVIWLPPAEPLEVRPR